MTAKTEKKNYSDTVRLPKTEFPMRGNLPKREPQWLDFWEENRIFEKMNARPGRDPFVLHDGPPYANGHIHIGHALNKVLKDVVVKSQSLMGKRTPYIPGWDCHGLPIEHALLKEKKMSKRAVDDVPAFRREAAAFAERWIETQKAEFRRLGVLAEWDSPYKTMSKRYEAAILKAFRLLYNQGFIYRGVKTVSWCVTCETALAEAEIEYKIKKSPSVFVALPVLKGHEIFGETTHPVEVVIWTTTPWTLPANKAVALHPKLEYCVVETELPDFGKRVLLIAKARLEAVLGAIGAESHKVLKTLNGRTIVEAGLVCETPFAYKTEFPHRESKGVLADYVSDEDGTGAVHTAPGHGADDYLTGVKEGLEILCPVDGGGRYTEEAGPDLAGKKIFEEGNPAVIEQLTSAGRMLASSRIEHNYQHCWRCRNPIAFRATEQWFLGVSKGSLRQDLLGAVGKVRWVPPQGEERISAMLSARPDWCLSRQRLWGTPIPIFTDADSGEVMADDEVLEAIEKKVAVDGSDFWFEEPGKPVVFGGEKEAGCLSWDFVPARKGRFKRETDILDVWMDSGASWLGVLDKEQVPCDLYLEGSDQHRGWFQSSLVMAVGVNGEAPYKAVLTHGFVLDDKGRAMSKSLGNTVKPQEVVDKLGADVLRLWVALTDYSDDVRLSMKLLAGPTDTYRKIRNTFKYLLGNTCDFDPAKDGVSPAEMPELERFVLLKLGELDRGVRTAYGDFAFRRAAIQLVDFCNLTLSAFYLDARKDALYTLKANDPVRRAAQTAMWECATRLAALAAPLLSYTCEEVWLELLRLRREQGSALHLPESVFLYECPEAPGRWDDAALCERWNRALAIRDRILKGLEESRSSGAIGKSLQARVVFNPTDSADRELVSGMGEDAWAELCIVSGFSLADSGEEIVVEKAPGEKCPRCWRVREDRGASADDPDLCSRCVEQLAP
jgi:isoleucyl-tRNA synthetase